MIQWSHPILWCSYFHIFDNMGNKPSDLQHIINIYGLLGFLQGLLIPISCLYCIWMNSPKRKQHKYSILSYWIFLWLFCLYCIWMNSPKGRQNKYSVLSFWIFLWELFYILTVMFTFSVFDNMEKYTIKLQHIKYILMYLINIFSKIKFDFKTKKLISPNFIISLNPIESIAF